MTSSGLSSIQIHGNTSKLASSSPEDLSPLDLDNANPRPAKARRTVLTTNACLRCRQRKIKCNGKHPICNRCHRDGIQCQYDVACEGVTKMQNLQNLLQSRDREIGKTTRLLGMLSTGSDQLATELLARLRLGETVDQILERYDEVHSSNAIIDPSIRMSERRSSRHPPSHHVLTGTASVHQGDVYMGGGTQTTTDIFDTSCAQLPEQSSKSSFDLNIDRSLTSNYASPNVWAPGQHSWFREPDDGHASRRDDPVVQKASLFDWKPRRDSDPTPDNARPARRVTYADIKTIQPKSKEGAKDPPKPYRLFWSGPSPLDGRNEVVRIDRNA